MDSKRQEIFAKMLKLAVENPSQSLDYLFLDLDGEDVSTLCKLKDGTSFQMKAADVIMVISRIAEIHLFCTLIIILVSSSVVVSNSLFVIRYRC